MDQPSSTQKREETPPPIEEHYFDAFADQERIEAEVKQQQRGLIQEEEALKRNSEAAMQKLEYAEKVALLEALQRDLLAKDANAPPYRELPRVSTPEPRVARMDRNYTPQRIRFNDKPQMEHYKDHQSLISFTHVPVAEQQLTPEEEAILEQSLLVPEEEVDYGRNGPIVHVHTANLDHLKFWGNRHPYVKEWIPMFLATAQQQGWNDRQKIAHLTSCFKGNDMRTWWADYKIIHQDSPLDLTHIFKQLMIDWKDPTAKGGLMEINALQHAESQPVSRFWTVFQAKVLKQKMSLEAPWMKELFFYKIRKEIREAVRFRRDMSWTEIIAELTEQERRIAMEKALDPTLQTTSNSQRDKKSHNQNSNNITSVIAAITEAEEDSGEEESDSGTESTSDVGIQAIKNTRRSSKNPAKSTPKVSKKKIQSPPLQQLDTVNSKLEIIEKSNQVTSDSLNRLTNAITEFTTLMKADQERREKFYQIRQNNQKAAYYNNNNRGYNNNGNRNYNNGNGNQGRNQDTNGNNQQGANQGNQNRGPRPSDDPNWPQVVDQPEGRNPHPPQSNNVNGQNKINPNAYLDSCGNCP